MKKLITLLLILALAMPTLALADLPDISGLTTEELLHLDWAIQDILFERTLEDGVLLPAGTYVVGADMPAGDFRADAVSDVGGAVTVYKNVDAYNKSDDISRVFLGNMYGTLTFHLFLEVGNVVTIQYNSLRLYKYHGLMDFQEGGRP